MISKRTLSRYIWTFKLASWFQTTSFDWDEVTQLLVLKTDKISSNIVERLTQNFRLLGNKGIRLFNLIYRIVAIAFIGYNLIIRDDVDAPEVILAFFYQGIYLLTLPTIVVLLIWDSKFVHYINSILRHNLELCKCAFLMVMTYNLWKYPISYLCFFSKGQNFNLNTDKRDGLEIISGIIFVVPIFSIVLGLPVAILQTLGRGRVFRFLFIRDVPTWINIVIGAGVQFQFIADGVCVITMSLLILIHTNSSTKWMNVCTEQL